MGKKNNIRSRSRGFLKRKGAATVELAVCLPVIVILAIGSMESASMIFLRQALIQSAYETCKESVKARGDQNLAITRGQQALAFRGIQGESITFNPPDVSTLTRGTPVTVTVSAPGDSNSVLPFGPFRGRNISATATMLKE